MQSKTGISLAVISFLGFLDATYLTFQHYLNRVPPCSVLQGCENVMNSSYSVVLGVPVALMGSIFYFLVFVGVIFAAQSQKNSIHSAVLYFSLLGFPASLWFVYLQLFVIRSICIYCMFSALTSTLLFVISLIYFYNRSKSNNAPDRPNN